jgi:Tfp pilus assembly protein FimT
VAVLAVQRKAAGLGESVKFGIGLGFLDLVGFLDALALGLELLATQSLGDVFLQGLAHLRHQLAQLAALPRGHAQRSRLFRCIEVVQIAQVRWCRPGGGHRQHLLAHQRSTTAANLAQHKQVVVRLLHAQPEARARSWPIQGRGRCTSSEVSAKPSDGGWMVTRKSSGARLEMDMVESIVMQKPVRQPC